MAVLARLPKSPTLPKLPGLPKAGGLTMAPPSPVKDEKSGPPEAPSTWSGSDLEWMVAWWLTQHRIPFQYQAPFLGGKATLGGQVVDFVVEDRQPPLLLGVQGEYWHYADSAKRARSKLAKVSLEAQGFEVVYLLGVDITTRLDFALTQALRGVQLFSDN
ncbi:MAG: hypothetical protein Q7O66_07430 [Dehalococcoidia bacterium]|nr:hypothetical protein [Dehalococcoidia bacterium]